MEPVNGVRTDYVHSKPIPLGRVKAFYFVSFCHLATYHRFITLYFEADGLTATQIGTLAAVFRVLVTVVTPLWAGVADHTKQARTMVQLSLVAGLMPFLALALPVATHRKFAARAAAMWAFALFAAPAMNLRDALARAACEQDVESWGRARLYGAVGWGLMHLALGPLLDWLGFGTIFVSFALLTVCHFFVMRSGVPQACGTVQREVTFQAISGLLVRHRWFFLNITAIGAGFSMVEGMLFLLLQELRASTLLCGLSVVVTVVFELPIFYYAKPLFQRLGARRMILLGQGAWVIRAIYYAVLTQPWLVLLIEPLHGVTFALVWTAAIEYIGDGVSGQGLEASAQGLLSACFGGLGPMLGLSLGGLLFDTIGSHGAYGLFATIIALAGLAYAVQTFEPSSHTPFAGLAPSTTTLGHQAVVEEILDDVEDDIMEAQVAA